MKTITKSQITDWNMKGQIFKNTDNIKGESPVLASVRLPWSDKPKKVVLHDDMKLTSASLRSGSFSIL
jgi:hypothetical protein